MLSREKISQMLVLALEELFEIEAARITPQAGLYDDLEIDSIDAIDLIDYIKRKTGYKLVAEDFRNVRTVDDVIDAVLRLQTENHTE